MPATQSTRTSVLTAQEILDQGLELGGNPSLTDLAKIFFNTFLDHLYRAKDWSFLLTDASGTMVKGNEIVKDFTFSDGYRAVAKLILRKDESIGQEKELVEVNYKDVWSATKYALDSGETSEPIYFSPSPQSANGSLSVYPVPDKAYKFDVLYYRQPAPITNYAHYPDFPDSQVLVNAVADFAANYERDTQQSVIQRNLDTALNKITNNSEDSGRARSLVMRFDPAVYRVWRGDG